MCASQIILTVDPPLGRVDYYSLSDQTLMELLFEGLAEETREIYKDEDGIYFDACKWPCVECDSYERVIEINVDALFMSGSLQLSYIPPKVRAFEMSFLQLEGSVDLTRLPEGIEKLSLGFNEFTGSIDCTRLPQSLVDLNLGNNELTGMIVLTNLPERLKFLYLYDNQLVGSLDLTELPGKMERFNVKHNQFSGSVDLTNLPQSMLNLCLGNNNLTGSFSALNLPPGLEKIDASGNGFLSVAVVGSESNTEIDLRKAGVTSVVDENGNKKVGRVLLTQGLPRHIFTWL